MDSSKEGLRDDFDIGVSLGNAFIAVGWVLIVDSSALVGWLAVFTFNEEDESLGTECAALHTGLAHVCLPYIAEIAISGNEALLTFQLGFMVFIDDLVFEIGWAASFANGELSAHFTVRTAGETGFLSLIVVVATHALETDVDVDLVANTALGHFALGANANVVEVETKGAAFAFGVVGLGEAFVFIVVVDVLIAAEADIEFVVEKGEFV